MKNKGLVYFLTFIISFLSIYYLQFTFVSQRIQNEATELSRDYDGNIDFNKKQKYLDSIWNKPVYNLITDFTYKEVKESELNLGLDLQGGMHVTLEVSPIDILKGLSSDSKDPDFLLAINNAREVVRGTQTNLISQFYTEFKAIAPEKDLSIIFATVSNRGRIGFDTSDDEILDIINGEVESAIDRSFNILRTRIDRFGTSQPNIQRLQGTGRIQIELPGVDNPERVRKLLQGVAKLEFWEVAELSETEIFQTLQIIDQFAVSANILGTQSDDNTSDISTEESDLEELFSENSDETQLSMNEIEDSLSQDLTNNPSPLLGNLRTDLGGLFYNLEDTLQINTIINNENVKKLIPSNIKFLWSVKSLTSTTDANGQVNNIDGEAIELFIIRTSRGGTAPLTGEVITDARQDLDQSARPSISMQMNSNGAKEWRKLTSQNIGRRVAIVLDDFVYSAPFVQNEIPNGNSQITGNFTIEEAQDLANILKAGTLPAPTTIVEDVVIGPTLGKVAQSQGIRSIVSGLMIVLVFMIFYYSGGGIVANLALFFNIFFILGILAQLSASLTLPGIAGIVLTIGMSIDANVLIFERIKEEIRNGANLKQAISNGYSKAYTSIIDANFTTFLVGLILYNLGQGPVKGFAVTLIIGIICSFFSAVFITRVIVEYFSRKGDKSLLRFSFPFTQNFLSKVNLNFLSRRKIAYYFSSVFLGLGFISFILSGLTLGVDFKGGRSYVVTFNSQQDPTVIETGLQESFQNEGVEVKTFGSDNVLKITTSYLIDDDTDDADIIVRESLIGGLSDITNLKFNEDDTRVDENTFTISSSSKVGATIADDIQNSSLYSGILALIAIFLYILIRFRKWQFSTGAVVALFHDTLFVLSAFSIANLFGISYEVDQVFIAALLTIIGYSINDTVVVFDRVRENLGIKAGSDVIPVVNESINKTISRTLITSLTTFVVVLVLFLFGGPSLSGFSFALLIGIIVGTYSSIFVATPVFVDLIKR
ncbi:MAG: protein translocase subunit SecDF [Amoebophilaceae bacterium TMED152]|nr:MAG: protein translocase subunit SecDF [Amoebophilaceae bacterium TMED152]|tara:strand:- start:2702 stop:5683 length:2982 start_codon:yes stop_codon:yes gene_type:complete